jgi:hypothetical protein
VRKEEGAVEGTSKSPNRPTLHHIAEDCKRNIRIDASLVHFVDIHVRDLIDLGGGFWVIMDSERKYHNVIYLSAIVICGRELNCADANHRIATTNASPAATTATASRNHRHRQPQPPPPPPHHLYYLHMRQLRSSVRTEARSLKIWRRTDDTEQCRKSKRGCENRQRKKKDENEDKLA